ncbi:hypothetical protein ILUMI_09870 [Ignelater luminosus]|uniref:Uncharacterized protein n=1 Tax=Ignelater luminosus TaxID=2038154 RepID=A0A8K0GC06_IGNLU|nr:hypothetical protein ILUMI_09870 [Ignelater luminosus]
MFKTPTVVVLLLLTSTYVHSVYYKLYSRPYYKGNELVMNNPVSEGGCETLDTIKMGTVESIKLVEPGACVEMYPDPKCADVSIVVNQDLQTIPNGWNHIQSFGVCLDN